MKIDFDRVYLPTEDGHFVSENQRRVAEILRDYDHNLQLQWIPPVERGPDEYAFRVVDVTPGHAPYVVTFAHECDERLLGKVLHADGKHGNVLNILDAHNGALELLAAKKRQEAQMEMHEMAASIIRSPKDTYKHNGIDFGKVNGGR
jgi:hypothetical protein